MTERNGVQRHRRQVIGALSVVGAVAVITVALTQAGAGKGHLRIVGDARATTTSTPQRAVTSFGKPRPATPAPTTAGISPEFTQPIGVATTNLGVASSIPEQTSTTTVAPSTLLPNPYANLRLIGPVKFDTYTISALRLLDDQAPAYFAPINHILLTQEVVIEYLPPGKGRKVYPTGPVATITVDESQIAAGVLEMAAGSTNDFGHIEQVNEWLAKHPTVKKRGVPFSVYGGVAAENEMLYRQASVQHILGDTQANIDHTLSFINRPSALVG